MFTYRKRRSQDQGWWSSKGHHRLMRETSYDVFCGGELIGAVSYRLVTYHRRSGREYQKPAWVYYYDGEMFTAPSRNVAASWLYNAKKGAS